MRKITKYLCIFLSSVLLVLLAIFFWFFLCNRSVQQYAKGVEEPFYTLVVNGKVVHHTYAVRFDRYGYCSAEDLQEEHDGRIEIPLLTVFDALGATCSKGEDGLILIECHSNKYILVPQRQAIFPITDHVSGDDPLPESITGIPDTSNLLLTWSGNENGYFREEQEEYIVDLSSLHALALSMEFTFHFDSKMGIVYFESNSAAFWERLPAPAH